MHRGPAGWATRSALDDRGARHRSFAPRAHGPRRCTQPTPVSVDLIRHRRGCRRPRVSRRRGAACPTSSYLCSMKQPRSRACLRRSPRTGTSSSSTTARPTALPPPRRAGGAHVVYEPRRGFGAACFAGLCAAESDVVAFMDCDGSLDGRDLPRVAHPVVDGHQDLVLGARVAEPGAWPWHLRIANRQLARAVRRRTGVPVTDLGSMRCGATYRARGPAPPGPAIRLAARDGPTGGRGGVADRRGRRGLPPPDRAIKGDRHPARHADDGARHAIGAAVTTVVVFAKEPRPGRVKTRLCPPCTPETAAAIASAALATRSRPWPTAVCSSRALVLDGAPGAWLPPGFTIVPQPGGDLGTRLAAAVDATTGPCSSSGWTRRSSRPRSSIGAAGSSTSRGSTR